MAKNSRTTDLRFLDAAYVADDRLDFDGLDVGNAAGEELGSVEGFIVERHSNRPYYLVVDSGGWFSSRHYLVPIGHVDLDANTRTLRLDIGRDAIGRFPEVHLDRFDEITDEEARRIDVRTLTALAAPTEVAARANEPWDYDRWSHFRQPDWWRAEPPTELPPPPLTNRPLAEDYDPTVIRSEATPESRVTGRAREHVVARHDETLVGSTDRDDPTSREAIARADRTADSTPPEDIVDRAQPGDVLGIETGGETTSLGDTARDEDERREAADEVNREIFREQRKD